LVFDTLEARRRAERDEENVPAPKRSRRGERKIRHLFDL